jgi:hypothetical protein
MAWTELRGPAGLASHTPWLRLGLAKNNPFVDSNERAVCMVVGWFSGSNRRELSLEPVELVSEVLALAKGVIGQGNLKRGSGIASSARCRCRSFSLREDNRA